MKAVVNIKEYSSYDATGLAQLVSSKQVTATELLTTAISICEQINPKINAVVYKCYDQAFNSLQQQQTTGLFSGVPFLLKDMGIFLEGTPTSNGSRLFPPDNAEHDSGIVKRFKNAGLIIFGKTNVPELGLNYTTAPELFGPCLNPWDLSCTPGGSSGGAAAAVAAGIVPMAHATDGCGSIRIPAACCGLFGLKPTRARVSFGPDCGEGWGGLVCAHVITRSVRDSALMLDQIAGYVSGDPYCAPSAKKKFARATSKKILRLKIALWNDHEQAISADCAKAVEDTAKLCELLGHDIILAKPCVDLEQLFEINSVIVETNTQLALAATAEQLGVDLSANMVENLTWEIAQRGSRHSATDYLMALSIMHYQSRLFAEFFDEYDMLLTPTLASIPLKIAKLQKDMKAFDGLSFYQDFYKFAPFTVIANQSGQPAMSVPLFWSKCGLPLGSHFIGRYGDEYTLLALARQLELAKPWSKLRPIISQL